jgi:hypothetical protein
MKLVTIAFIAIIALGSSLTIAAAESGPVATACKDDIQKFCAGKDHGAPGHEVDCDALMERVLAKFVARARQPDPLLNSR